MVRHGQLTAASDEATYNAELIAALKSADVEVIAITDHYRVRESKSLIDAAKAAGITVLPGFEAVSSDGVHLLCIFESTSQIETIEARISQCGVIPSGDVSPIGDKSALQILDSCAEWGAVCIAAHATFDNGLLKHLQGLPRIKTWKSPHLHAVAIPNSIDTAPPSFRAILLNDDAEHRRHRLPAVLNAGDISSPEDVGRSGATCRLKLSELSLGALRQAFLDPESRVKLDSDGEDKPRPAVKAIHWEGGFLSDETVQFEDGLTVLVGAPGAGKSTVIESLRAAFNLAPESERARADHDGILKSVIGAGTTISVVVEYADPAPVTYVVQRTLPHPPTVLRAENWKASGLDVSDLAPPLQIFGQHEVADLAEDATRRTALLERFAKRRDDRNQRLVSIDEELKKLGADLTAAKAAVEDMESRLSLLPGQEERLKQYEDAGIADQLQLQTKFDREHRVITTARTRLTELENRIEDLDKPLRPVVKGNTEIADSEFLSELERLDSALADVGVALSAAHGQIAEAIASGRQQIDQIFEKWKQRRADGDKELQETKDRLNDQDIDWESYRSLRSSIDTLRELSPQLKDAQQQQKTLVARRTELLAEQERLLGLELQDLSKAASQVTSQLDGTVQVAIMSSPDFDEIEALLRSSGRGRLHEAFELFRADGQFSPRELAEKIRAGAQALTSRWNISGPQADRLAQTGLEQTLRLEELKPQVLTSVELNVSTTKGARAWHKLRSFPRVRRQRRFFCCCCWIPKRRSSLISLKTTWTTASSPIRSSQRFAEKRHHVSSYLRRTTRTCLSSRTPNSSAD